MSPEGMATVIEAVVAILVVALPTMGIYLKKVSTIAKKAAQRSEAEEQLLLVVGEALADGDLSNDEIKAVLQKGRAAGVETKELIQDILELFRKSK